MISGTVRPSRADGSGLEAWVEIAIAGHGRIFHTLEAIVDTACTGWLILPESAMPEFGLHTAGLSHSILANGQEEETVYCAAVVLWHGRAVDIWIDIMGNMPVIGTDLLSGSRLTVDWWDGGAVVVEERMP